MAEKVQVVLKDHFSNIIAEIQYICIRLKKLQELAEETNRQREKNVPAVSECEGEDVGEFDE